ncbi:MAG: protein-disulfide reductase DsbD domain-containing protein, partial [Pseudomonadota bacterium]
MILTLWLASIGGAHAIDAKDLLPPDQAYAYSARSVAADMVRVEWRIADGYYLYRDKLRFESGQTEVGLGTPVLPPPSETKTDEFFGEMAIYRGTLTVDIPLLRGRDDRLAQFTLLAHSQGCADVGVCFPPHTQTAKLQLIDPPSAAGSGGANGGLRGLFASLGDKLGLKAQQEEFLDPEQAFVVSIDTPAPDRAVARWQIAEGYYLYRDKFAFTLRDADGVTLGSHTSPPGVEKVDESFGRSEVYYEHVSFDLPLTRNTASAQPVTLEVRYQGCADAGLCYPPITKNLPVNLPA